MASSLPARRMSRNFRSRMSTGLFRKRGKRIRKIDPIMQIDEVDCGAACLGMICRYFGRKVSVPRIRELCHTATDGTSLKAISRAATELGLAARALKISVRNLPLHAAPGHRSLGGKPLDRSIRCRRAICRASLILRVDCENFRVANSKQSGAAMRLCSITRPHSNKRRRASQRLAWVLPFLARFKVILFQVLSLGIAVSFRSTPLSSIHPDRRRQGHCRKRRRSIEDDPARHARGASCLCNSPRSRRNICWPLRLCVSIRWFSISLAGSSLLYR